MNLKEVIISRLRYAISDPDQENDLGLIFMDILSLIIYETIVLLKNYDLSGAG